MSAQALLDTIDVDIIVLATPEIAGLSGWVVGLVAAGGLAAALSTASGLMLVISSSVAHDVYGQILRPDSSDDERLLVGRIAIFIGVLFAGYLGISPPAFVGEVVAFAFGLAAASFFPVLLLGVFWKRCNKQGAIAGMSVGLILTFAYIVMTADGLLDIDPFFFGINAQGIGAPMMVVSFVVTVVISLMTPPPPRKVQNLVEQIRYPRKLREDELEEISV